MPKVSVSAQMSVVMNVSDSEVRNRAPDIASSNAHSGLQMICQSRRLKRGDVRSERMSKLDVRRSSDGVASEEVQLGLAARRSRIA